MRTDEKEGLTFVFRPFYPNVAADGRGYFNFKSLSQCLIGTSFSLSFVTGHDFPVLTVKVNPLYPVYIHNAEEVHKHKEHTLCRTFLGRVLTISSYNIIRHETSLTFCAPQKEELQEKLYL